MRDRRDVRTLDLFAPATGCRHAIDGLFEALASVRHHLDRAYQCWPGRPFFVDFPINRKGPLTEEEKDEIFRLAEEEKLAAWSVAKRIGRHPASVSWYMTRVGLKRLAPIRKAPFLRNGEMVYPFSEEEDAYLLRRSLENAIPAEIKREMDELFPHHKRSRDTLACRLMMLASDEAAREAA